MKKIQPQELLSKIIQKINNLDLQTLKADSQVLITKKISLQDLQELLTKLSKNKNKLILIIAVISIILCLDFFFVLRFQMRALGTIKPKIVRLRRGLNNLNNDLNMMQRQERGLAIGTVKEIVPTGQMPWVIEEISRLANQREVRIFQIKPHRQLSEEKDAKKIRTRSRQEHPLIFIDLEVSAGYHQLGRLLADLENHSIFLEIAELAIKHSQEDPFVHRIKVRLQSYLDNE